VLLVGGGLLRADDRPASVPAPASDPFAATKDHPLTAATWPLWREVYLQIFFDDTTDPVQDRMFYEQTRAFFTATAAASGGSLPGEFASDPIAWVVVAYSHLHQAGDDPQGGPARGEGFTRAEAAGRRAIALGDPNAIASYTLATILVSRGLSCGVARPATGELARQLTEAEELLRHVEQVAPRAAVELWQGQIARLRGDAKGAEALLRRSTEEHPRSASAASAYLTTAMSAAGPSARLADLTGPFAGRFPDNANIQAIHAAALYRDQRYSEAAEALRCARNLDDKVARFLGEEAVNAIEEGHHLAAATDGVQALKAGQYEAAASSFRRALAADPRNPLAARLLARAIAHQLTSSHVRPTRSAATAAAGEIGELCRRFPEDVEMQGALAVALHLSGRDGEAGDALDRVQRLGGRPEELIDAAGVSAIREAAATDRTARFWQTIALAAVVGAAAWIAAMFALGAVLAACIPRVPVSVGATGPARSRREAWLERFYLVVLSLGLLAFYASVPVVALGLLAVTLALFGLMLAIRIIHFGVLYRGLWATGNVLRCALMGPRPGVMGIEATAEEHPRLLEVSRAVAERLQTRPVDALYLTPSSHIAVYQEGSGPFGLLGTRRRVLEVGISTLPLLTRGEFESILAHEYGHFSHRDPFYGRFIFQVSASLATSLAVMRAAGGVLNYVNPFFWFWWLYLRSYTLLAAGFSRSREFLADRRAVAAYGKQAFVSGLTKVSVDGALFESTIYANVQHLLTQGKVFINAFDAFRHFREETEAVQSRERLLESLRQSRPGWFDTHPTFAERLAAVDGFPDAAPPAESEPAISLLSDHQAVEAKLTEILTHAVFRLSRGEDGPE
jgi:Zn-dependent protease with chaperone function/tetratricopeptide (TPR) repeat protein